MNAKLTAWAMTGRVAAFAARYWAAIFALGFVLATLRTLWLAPWLGSLAAVAVELPVMLGASWWVAGRLLRRQPLSARAALGAGLLALLLLSELALAMVLAGDGPRQWLAALGRPPGALGLAGQVAFALMPLAQARR